MTGVRVNKRGNYACEFCSHKSWKQQASAIKHVEEHHALELAQAEAAALRLELKAERTKPPRVVEKVVYKDKPDPKYVGSYTLYCAGCKTVMHNVGIPYGQTIENTPHTCGVRALQVVLNET